MNKLAYIFGCLAILIPSLKAQIMVDINAPYNDPAYLVEEVLLGDGVTASNVVFSGDLVQIGYFDGSASNIDFNAGIVLSTGEVANMDPVNGGIGWNGPNTATDPDLLNVSNIVPPILGFTGPSDINDVAVLEFDFVPNSDELSFDFVFGSEEYFGFENSVYNDVFGFFLSGPAINGPYSAPAAFPNGSVNLALVPGSNPVLPISISSINSVTPINEQFFIDNSNYTTVAGMDGFTVRLKAKAQVECGETYHIRLAIADAQDQGLDSYVLFGEKSFLSPSIGVTNTLTNDDTTYLEIPCGAQIDLECTATNGSFNYQWYENGQLLAGQTSSSISVGPGIYSIEASEVGGCSFYSDTIEIIEAIPTLTLGSDYEIACNTTTFIGATVYDGSPPFNYLWSNASTQNSIEVGPGTYDLAVTDALGCTAFDTIVITAPLQPEVQVSGGGVACADGTQVNVVFDLVGTQPYQMVYTDGSQQYALNNFNLDQYILSTNTEGTFEVLSIQDANCSGIFSGSATVELKPLPSASLTGGGVICPFDSAQVSIEMLGTLPYSLELSNGLYSLFFDSITSPILSFYTNQNGNYSLSKLTDGFGCIASDLDGVANITVLDYVQPTILPISDTLICAVDSAFQLTTLNPGGEWSGVGINPQGVFDPRRAGVGIHWVYYQIEYNCQEIDSITIEVGCDLQIYVPNTFTPNGDEHNELLAISGTNVLEFSFVVYSQWGQKLFETNQLSDYWDGSYKGKTVPVGVYSYHITAYGKDDQFVSKTGTVNVLK